MTVTRALSPRSDSAVLVPAAVALARTKREHLGGCVAARLLLYSAVMLPTKNWPLLLTGLLLACGGKSFESGTGPEGGSGGSAQAGTDAGARDGGGTSSGGSSSTGGKGGSSTGGMATGGTPNGCDAKAYPDESGGNVPVRLVNGTDKPIYLGQQMPGCSQGPLFQVADGSGQPLPAPGFCQPTCSQVIQHQVIGCPALACAINSTITLAPGESTLSLWSALFSEKVELSRVCAAAAGQAECTRIASVTPGDYVFSAQAGTNLQCMAPGAGECGTCMPNPNGGCNTFGAVITEPLVQAKVEVKLDGSYGIGGPGGGGMVREVVIEFK